MLSTTSTTSGSASSSIRRGMSVCSGRPCLIDVRLLRHVRLGVLGLGGAVDPAVPPNRATAALLVLERRPLRLQLVDEVGDVGGVLLPEERHGRRERRGEPPSLAGARRPPAQAGTRRTCSPSRRNACCSPVIQRASSSSRAVPTSNAGKTALTVSKPSTLAT